MNDSNAARASRPAAASRLEAGLVRLANIAEELGAATLASDAWAEDRRLAAGRFFVACVGQFKRGKSTLLNALVGHPVLPVGVVPVTSVITILSHGSEPRATVRFEGGREEYLELDRIAEVIDERSNPRNTKGVVAVDVALPASVLANGLCLVDTPGIGSVFRENTDATRRFVPQVDVALVVVGPDPPISGEELALIEEVSRDAAHLVVVLNKADQVSRQDREEVLRFTAAALAQRLHRPIGRILEVSALERVQQDAPTRDWAVLEGTLESLATERYRLVASAADRARRRLARRVLAEVDSQESALRRPIQETADRVTRLREAAAAADRSLRELRFLLDSVEAELGKPLEQARLDLVAEAAPGLRATLNAWIAEHAATLPARQLTAHAFEQARTIVERAVLTWMERLEPQVIFLYETAAERFTDLAGEYAKRISTDLAGIGPEELPPPKDPGYSRRHFQFTALMHLTAGSPATWIIERLAPTGLLSRTVQQRAATYLDHLLETNSHRVQNDFRERSREAREALEQRIGSSITDALATAERALETATASQNLAEHQVQARLERLRALRTEVESQLAT